MALHDPVEDALNERKKRARLVETEGAFSPNTLDLTRKFLGGRTPGAPSSSGRGLPSQASPTARSRFGGQQGVRSRFQRPTQAVQPTRAAQPTARPFPGSLSGPRQFPGDLSDRSFSPTRSGSLSDRFFNLPGPVNFAQSPQGRAILQRILGRRA